MRMPPIVTLRKLEEEQPAEPDLPKQRASSCPVSAFSFGQALLQLSELLAGLDRLVKLLFHDSALQLGSRNTCG